MPWAHGLGNAANFKNGHQSNTSPPKLLCSLLEFHRVCGKSALCWSIRKPGSFCLWFIVSISILYLHAIYILLTFQNIFSTLICTSILQILWCSINVISYGCITMQFLSTFIFPIFCGVVRTRCTMLKSPSSNVNNFPEENLPSPAQFQQIHVSSGSTKEPYLGIRNYFSLGHFDWRISASTYFTLRISHRFYPNWHVEDVDLWGAWHRVHKVHMLHCTLSLQLSRIWHTTVGLLPADLC